VYQLGALLIASLAFVSCTQYGGKEAESAKSSEVMSAPAVTPQTPPMDLANEQRSPSSQGRTSCPDGFTLIKDPKGNFCISSKVEPANDYYRAGGQCEAKTNTNGSQTYLCTLEQWRMACRQSQKNNNPLGMGNNRGGVEWVADLRSTSGQVMGDSGCGSFNYITVFNSYGSRCCFR
jgi:hypothetical protein